MVSVKYCAVMDLDFGLIIYIFGFHSGEELNQPTVFNIKIESLDETAPVVTLNEIANKIEQLG